jgi:hypothetical protein
MSVIIDLKNLAQEWYTLRAERKLSEPFVARRFLGVSQIGSTLMHLARFQAELPRNVPFFWSDLIDNAQHEREMLRYKLRKEDIDTLSFRATDNYLDELKSLAMKATERHEASERQWNGALKTDKPYEDLLRMDAGLWAEFEKAVVKFWDGEVKPYMEMLVLLADESPGPFVREKLELNALEVLESVRRKNAGNRDAFQRG